MSKSTKVCPKCNARIKGLDNCSVVIDKCPNCNTKLD